MRHSQNHRFAFFCFHIQDREKNLCRLNLHRFLPFFTIFDLIIYSDLFTLRLTREILDFTSRRSKLFVLESISCGKIEVLFDILFHFSDVRIRKKSKVEKVYLQSYYNEVFAIKTLTLPVLLCKMFFLHRQEKFKACNRCSVSRLVRVSPPKRAFLGFFVFVSTQHERHGQAFNMNRLRK